MATKISHFLIRSGYDYIRPCECDETPRGTYESFQLLKPDDYLDYFCQENPRLIPLCTDEAQLIINRYLESTNVRLFPDPLGNPFINSKSQV